MSKRVTIKTIADDLGISHMTVSRALAGHPNVQEKTRDAIRKRAHEMGYVRSAAAKAMRGDRSPIIGVLIPNLTNDFYARFANALAEKCEARGLQLIINLTREDPEAEQSALTGLEELQARAAILVPTAHFQQSAASQVDGSMTRIQLIRQVDRSDAIASVLVDDHEAICAAVAHLSAQGHRRIAFIGASQELSSGRARFASFQEGLTRCGLNADDNPAHTVIPSVETGYACARQILAAKDATALICGGFELSHGALKACIEANAIPGKLAFVGYGDPDYYGWLYGGLTTIRVPVADLVDCALAQVFATDETDRGVFRFAAELVTR